MMEIIKHGGLPMPMHLHSESLRLISNGHLVQDFSFPTKSFCTRWAWVKLGDVVGFVVGGDDLLEKLNV